MFLVGCAECTGASGGDSQEWDIFRLEIGGMNFRFMFDTLALAIRQGRRIQPLREFRLAVLERAALEMEIGNGKQEMQNLEYELGNGRFDMGRKMWDMGHGISEI